MIMDAQGMIYDKGREGAARMKIEILGQEREYPQGITYEQIAADYQEQYGGLIALVIHSSP